MKARHMPPYAFLLTIVIVFFITASPEISLAGTRVVDGNPGDWIGVPPSVDNLGRVSNGEYVWRDAQYDERTDLVSPHDSSVDLREFRVTGDASNLYVLACFEDLLLPPWPVQIQIAIDQDQVLDGGQLWFTGYADTKVNSRAQWEFLINTLFGSGGEAEVLDQNFVRVGSTPAVVNYGTNCVEIGTNWSMIGGPPAGPIRFTVAVFHQNTDNSTMFIPGTSSVLDAITDYGDPELPFNTWDEVFDRVVDYYFDLLIDQNGVYAIPSNPPVAYDQYVTTYENTPIDITLAAFDPDNDPLLFTVVSGPTNGTLSGVAPNLTYSPNPGYIGPDSFTFIANDGASDSNIAMVSVNVIRNLPPMVQFTVSPDPPVVSGVMVMFEDRESYDPDGYLVSYFWDFGDGTPVVSGPVEWYGVPPVQHAYLSEGTYTATLTLTDDLGVSGTAQREIQVIANDAPVSQFTATPNPVLAGATVRFDGSASYDPNASGGDYIVSYRWDFGDGTVEEMWWEAEHVYASAGTYTATLTVRDQGGLTGTSSVQINVAAGSSPVAQFTATPNPVAVGARVRLDGSTSYDPDVLLGDRIVSYEWDFGDGAVASGSVVDHIYSSTGTFDVTLRVRDLSGNEGTSTQTVTAEFGIINGELPDALVGSEYHQTFEAGGADTGVAWSMAPGPFSLDGPVYRGQAGTACEGLLFDPATALISGSAVRGGACGPFTVEVSWNSQAAQKAFTILVHEARLYVVENGTNRLLEVDPVTQSVVDWVELPGNPLMVALTPDGRYAYVTVTGEISSLQVPNLSDTRVAVVDTSTKSVVTTIELGAGNNPTGVAVSPDGRWVYVPTNYSQMAVIDSGTNTVVAWVPVGSTSTSVAFSPDGRFAYVGSFSSGLTVVDTTTHTPVNYWGWNAVSVAAGLEGRYVYLLDSSRSVIRVIDAATGEEAGGEGGGGSVPVGQASWRLSVSPDGRWVYVPTDSGLKVLDILTREISRTLPQEVTDGLGIAVSPDGGFGYVSSFGSGRVEGWDLRNGTVLTGVSAIDKPAGIAAAPNPVLHIATESLPLVLIGQPYDFTLIAAGGVPPYSWNVSGLPEGFSVDSQGRITGTPSLAGIYPVTVTVTDSALPSQTISKSYNLEITKSGANQLPIAVDDAYETAEDDALTVTAPGILINDSDADGDKLGAIVLTSPLHGTLILKTDGSFTYIPYSNYHGADSFTYKAGDGTGYSNEATVMITVTSVNDVPIANEQSVMTNEDTPASIVLTASDVDGDSLTFSIVTGPTQGTLTGTPPNITYTPVSNFNGTDSFTFKVNDGYVDSTIATVGITVEAVNDVPIANEQSVMTNEDTPASIVLTASDVDGDSLTFSIVTGPTQGTLTGTPPNITYTPVSNFIGTDSFTFKVNDGQVDSDMAVIVIRVMTASNVPPVVGPITAPVDPVAMGMSISVSSPFNDSNVLDTHTATWQWDDGTISAGIISESNGSGTVIGSHVYSSPGVYTVTLYVTDNAGNIGVAVLDYVVVYDPAGGFVTGAGWINSPAGAFVPNPALTGKATFGFVSKYKKSASVPTGETEFQFKVADLNFHSTAYEWLIVSGALAQYKGTGTINGEGNYGFMITAIDGALRGGGGADKFRIKIWNRATDQAVYDNMLGASVDADPTTVIGGGSIVIHK